MYFTANSSFCLTFVLAGQTNKPAHNMVFARAGGAVDIFNFVHIIENVFNWTGFTFKPLPSQIPIRYTPLQKNAQLFITKFIKSGILPSTDYDWQRLAKTENNRKWLVIICNWWWLMMTDDDWQRLATTENNRKWLAITCNWRWLTMTGNDWK